MGVRASARRLHQADVLTVEITFDAFDAAFVALPAVLDATHRGFGQGHRQAIDGNHAGFDFIRGSQRRFCRRGENVGRKPIGQCVRFGDDFVEIVSGLKPRSSAARPVR